MECMVDNWVKIEYDMKIIGANFDDNLKAHDNVFEMDIADIADAKDNRKYEEVNKYCDSKYTRMETTQ